jgi:HEAT repeat protein
MTERMLKDFLIEMADLEREVRASDLLLLGGILIEELHQFRSQWNAIEDQRRVEIVSQMVEMAEESADLDFNTFFHFCVSDTGPQVRERAIAGLWESEDRSVLSLLVGCMVNDTAASVRAEAAMVLGRFAILAQGGKLLARDGKRVYETLLEALSRFEEELEVRRRALESIGAFQSDEVKQWVAWGYESQDTSLRQSALCAMGRSCDSSWLPVIYGEMENEDPAMRYEAANACREMGEEEAVPHLASLVEDYDLQVQLAAILALGAIGGTVARSLLRKCIRTADDEVVRDAAEVALEVTQLEEDPLRFKPTR